MVAGLYGAGALIAPPERPPLPDFPDPSAQLDELREDFERLRDYLRDVDLPPVAAAGAERLDEVPAALLDPGWAAELLAQDPESLHVLARTVRRDVPEAVEHLRPDPLALQVAPGQQPPEHHLERRLALLHEELLRTADALRETEARRQESHTRYLEDRGQSG